MTNTDPTWTPPIHGVSRRMIADRQCRIEKIGQYFGAVVGGRLGSALVEARVTCSTRAAAQAWCEAIAGDGGKNPAVETGQ